MESQHGRRAVWVPVFRLHRGPDARRRRGDMVVIVVRDSSGVSSLVFLDMVMAALGGRRETTAAVVVDVERSLFPPFLSNTCLVLLRFPSFFDTIETGLLFSTLPMSFLSL